MNTQHRSVIEGIAYSTSVPSILVSNAFGMVQEALHASLPLTSPIYLALQKIGGSAHACKSADPLAKLLPLLLIIPFSILDKLLVPYLKADYILSCSPALMSARQTINSLKTSLQAQQTIANR